MQADDVRMLEELIANLRADIYVADYTHCTESWRDIDYIPDHNKFYFIEDGEGWLKIGDREYYPRPGQLFLMPSGVLQSYSVTQGRPFTKYWCHFSAKIGDISLFDVLDLPHFVDVCDTATVAGLFRALIEAHNGGGVAAGLKSRSALFQIIAMYLDASQVKELRLKHVSALHRLNGVLSYIGEHIDREMSAAELARTLHYHPNYFTRMFRKYTGMAPTQYINKMRLEKAKVLLRTTDMLITEVAAATGFGDIYYFSKSFRKYTGFSPSDYRSI